MKKANQTGTREGNAGTQVACFRHVRPREISKRPFVPERFVVSSIERIPMNSI